MLLYIYTRGTRAPYIHCQRTSSRMVIIIFYFFLPVALKTGPAPGLDNDGSETIVMNGFLSPSWAKISRSPRNATATTMMAASDLNILHIGTPNNTRIRIPTICIAIFVIHLHVMFVICTQTSIGRRRGSGRGWWVMGGGERG